MVPVKRKLANPNFMHEHRLANRFKSESKELNIENMFSEIMFRDSIIWTTLLRELGAVDRFGNFIGQPRAIFA